MPTRVAVSAFQGAPESFAGPAAAERLARAAYRRAARLSSTRGAPLLGVGCAAALAAEPLRRGTHRCHVAAATGLGLHTFDLKLAKGARSRQEEDDLASKLVLRAVGRACGIGDEDVAALWEEPLEGDELHEAWQPMGDPFEAVLAGRAPMVELHGSFEGLETEAAVASGARLVLPGSFNPLHEGHLGMMDAAAATLGLDAEADGVFELAVVNADKGAMDAAEARRRAAQFSEKGRAVALTAAPIFSVKAELFPGAAFVVGYDTARRLVMPKYYGDGSLAAMLDAFGKLRQNGCRLVVAGRLDAAQGRFLTLDDVPNMPAELRDLFIGIDEEVFRNDISSTALRARRGKES